MYDFNVKTNNIIKNNIKCMRKQIWYVDLSGSVGSEQSSMRPFIIIQNDIGNKYSPTIIGAPITDLTHNKKKLGTHVEITDKYKQFGLNKPSIILLEQTRVIDKSRLKSYIGEVDEETMIQVEKALLFELGIDIDKLINNNKLVV